MLELIVTHPDNLKQVYGRHGSKQILTAIEVLCEASIANGITSKVIQLDEPTPAHWRFASGRLLDFIDECGPDQILIVGGDQIVPFCRVPDRCPHPEDDGWIYTDSPDTGWTRQNAPGPGIGRMPGDGTGDATFITTQLHRAAAAHRQGGIVLTVPAHAFSEELGMQNTTRVLEEAGVPDPWTLYACPPYGLLSNDKVTVQMQAAFLRRQALLYFVLHGQHRTPCWWGYPTYLPPWEEAELPQKAAMVDHRLIADAAPTGSVVCAGVCQAAYPFGKTSDSSLALRFIKEGALGVIAPTTMVYEYVPTVPGPLDGIDRLFADILSGLLDDIPTGQALAEAKRAHRLLDPPDEKNVLSLVLYGDPGLTIKIVEVP